MEQRPPLPSEEASPGAGHYERSKAHLRQHSGEASEGFLEDSGDSGPVGPEGGLRYRLHEIIFEADTPAGKAFDVALLVFILLSVCIVLLDSVASFHSRYGMLLGWTEWILTIGFTIEYGLRLYAVRRPWHYASSFFGIVDVLAILPTYLALVVPGGQGLLVIRALRLLRVFRIFKLARYVDAYRVLIVAMQRARPKIIVFMIAVLTIVTIIGSLMYLVESNANSGFSSIPAGIYWAIVTVTTVGFGDITPTTTLGQFFAAVLMITGYAIIAVPTGIVSVEIAKADDDPVSTQSCPDCGAEGHHHDARHCYRCGADLHA